MWTRWHSSCGSHDRLWCRNQRAGNVPSIFIITKLKLHQDKDGYTPLHIAAGYLHEQTVSVLMRNPADPTLEDNSGRSVRCTNSTRWHVSISKFPHQALSLVEALLQNTPATTALFTKRLAMEAVLTTLRSYMFEEIVPRAIIDKRTTSQTQYFVDWYHCELVWASRLDIISLFSYIGYDPIWVDETDIADDLIKEFESGVERASVSKIIHTKNLSAAVDYPALSLVQVNMCHPVFYSN